MSRDLCLCSLQQHIYQNWNDTEKITMALPKRMAQKFLKCPHFCAVLRDSALSLLVNVKKMEGRGELT